MVFFAAIQNIKSNIKIFNLFLPELLDIKEGKTFSRED